MSRTPLGIIHGHLADAANACEDWLTEMDAPQETATDLQTAIDAALTACVRADDHAEPADADELRTDDQWAK